MNVPSNLTPNHAAHDEWEAMVRHQARTLVYPPTPNFAPRVSAHLRRRAHHTPRAGQARRWQPIWVAITLLALFLSLWSVPPVRAALLDFLQIGVVRIWLGAPSPTPNATPTLIATVTPAHRALVGPTQPTPTPPPFFNLAGASTLEDAAAALGAPIRLPTFPADVGLPDAVFVQDLNGPAVVLVWQNPTRPTEAIYTLHILGNNIIAEKMNPRVVLTTTVNNHPAAWTVGPYVLAYGTGQTEDWQLRYLVTGRVLIWQEAGLTYRLESNLPLEEAIRMAESLE